MLIKLHKKSKWPPTFIVGCPRSGTTLLAAILNRHPQVCVPPESHFYRYMHEHFKGGWEWVKANWPQNALQFLAPITEYYWTDYRPEELIHDLPHPPKNEGYFFIHLVNRYAKDKNKNLWIEKTPDHLRFIDRILIQHPDARFIYIYRDGRDVALSLCKTGWPWITDDFLDNMLLWSKYIEKEKSLKKAQSCHRIKYENLISDPPSVIKELCAFLDIEYFPSMLIPDNSEHHLAERQSKHKQKIFLEIDPNNKKKWKTGINEGIGRLATTLFKHDLLSHNYSLDIKNPNNKIILSCHKSLFFDYSRDNYSKFASSAMIEQLDKYGYAVESFTWQDFPDCISAHSIVVIPDYQIGSNYRELIWLIKNLIRLKIKNNCRIILLKTNNNNHVSTFITWIFDKKIPFSPAWRKTKTEKTKTVIDLWYQAKQLIQL
ncbi:protein-tyrosine sulfotransferase [Methylomarinovum tepidoasis]|uniref:Protein-tyrosine sulfotransferase n=1 Tax=Methylomarinovum tepidoasis TaxID=2840183 RepID=A0AAU9CZ94_9GAMM|nr:sulfotransferase [Methylomarinovum sp. IN45]BCX89354.1 protein-tyrosine sulfotransferase [Methylomarinovum sp. IN45]